MPYRIDYSVEARGHVRNLSAAQRSLIADQVRQQLTDQATVVARNRKPLRPNRLAAWELRLGDLRVFYDVLTEPDSVVVIRAIGVKVRDRVFIDNRETDL